MPLTISVALLPKLLPSDWERGDTLALVIDTLRFTSTACVALAAGAKAITVVSDIQRAKQLAATLPGGAKLCGERECVRIAGFDLGNSPAEYTPASVAGRELVFSTTNGTFAVEAALPARHIILTSLVNRSAVCRWLTRTADESASNDESASDEQSASDGLSADDGQEARHVWCLCAGTDGQVAFEDVLTAGATIERLTSLSSRWRLGNDASLLALEAWKRVADAPVGEPGEPGGPARNATALVERLRLALGGRNLVEAGFADDLWAVAQLDSLDVVPGQISPGRFERLS